MQLFGKDTLCNWAENMGFFVSLTLTHNTLYFRHFYIPTWHGAVQVKQDYLLFFYSLPILKKPSRKKQHGASREFETSWHHYEATSRGRNEQN